MEDNDRRDDSQCINSVGLFLCTSHYGLKDLHGGQNETAAAEKYINYIAIILYYFYTNPCNQTEAGREHSLVPF